MPSSTNSSARRVRSNEQPERARTGKGGTTGRRKKANAGGEAHPHTEENLDHGLKETFPASDPVSISPGAD